MSIKSMITKVLVVCGAILLIGVEVLETFGEEISLKDDYIYAEEIVIEESIDKEYNDFEAVIEEPFDELQQLYNDLHFDMTYEEIITTIEATELPYNVRDYNHSKAIKIAFEKEVTPHKYAKEGDHITLHFKDIIQDNRYEVYIFEEISYWNSDAFKSESKINESSNPKELALNPPIEIEQENNNEIIIEPEKTEEYFNSNIRCEVCEQNGTELEIWYDSNNVKHYTCLEKCTNGLDVLYGPNVREKDTTVEENNDNVTDDEIVYWTRGKSYHKSSSCYHYVNAKYHYKGSKSKCPKYDPCDDCCY